MLISTFVRPKTLGVTDEGLYVVGVDFSCSATSCYSTDLTVKSTFVSLQKTLNRLAGKLGYSVLATDGVIGRNTITAASKAAAYVLSIIPGSRGATAVQANPSTANVAAWALQLASEAGQVADLFSLRAPPAMMPKTDADANVPAEAVAPTEGHSHLWLWVGGAVGVIGLGTLGYFVWKKKMKKGRRR